MLQPKNTERKLALVTGATGMLGSHIAEQLRLRDFPVRAIVRASSDTTFLKSIGVETVRGSLEDPASLKSACQGVDVVYHAAARVGDWGPWHEFVRDTIEGTQHLLDAAADAKLRRFLHISSISAYGHVNGEGRVFDESAPLGRELYKWAYYSRAKVEAEHRVWAMHKSGQLPVTVIRPSWLYGLRDRATLSRLLDSIRRKKLRIIGDGKNRLNVVNSANVAEAAVLAANHPAAVGEAYNCCHDGVMTQRQYFDMLAAAIGEPPVARSISYRVVYNAAFAMECAGHLFKSKKPPLITRYALWLMGRRCFFECEKIKQQIGWKSTIGYREGIAAAVAECTGRNITHSSQPLAQVRKEKELSAVAT